MEMEEQREDVLQDRCGERKTEMLNNPSIVWEIAINKYVPTIRVTTASAQAISIAALILKMSTTAESPSDDPYSAICESSQPNTHALRNPHLPIQLPRVLTKATGTLTDGQKASDAVRVAAEKEKRSALVEALDKLLEQHELEIKELARKHCVSPEYVAKIKKDSKHFKGKREVGLYNAKVHAKAVEVNGGQFFSLFLSIY
jgi:hypothetical protein